MKKAIYIITNQITNKQYVGQSQEPARRWQIHKQRARHRDYQEHSALYAAMNKYGIDNFTFKIIGWYEDYNEKEQYYIRLYNTLTPNGYNILSGGQEPPHLYGEDHPNSHYSQKLIDDIIQDLLSGNYTQKQIQDKYGVSQQLVTSINLGHTHKKDNLTYPLIKYSNYHLLPKEIEEIRYLLKESTCTCKEIAIFYHVTTSTIKHINAGRNYYDPTISYPIRNFRGSANSQSVEAILAKRSTETIDTSLEM